MSTVTASVVDGSRTIYSIQNGNRGHNNTGQCKPMPLPALGTQKIVQGNGTEVGTVITLQCPPRHRLVGANAVSCVWGSNTTHWSGGSPWCKPVSLSEDFGFRVAVMASIISCAIILLLSMAFLTCCLLDCVKEGERKKDKRDTDLWHQLEQVEQEGNRASRYGHKGRNNNNNTTNQMKTLSAWDNHDPSSIDHRIPNGGIHSISSPVSAPGFCSALNSALLPCRGYNQPLHLHNQGLHHKSGLMHNPGLLPNSIGPLYPGVPQTPCLAQNPEVLPASGLTWQNGGQKGSLSGMSTPLPEKDYGICPQPYYDQEHPIKVISV
ncbi:sushi domain-containing protein 3 [Esox lucius]|uniref:Sushi domain-containing protein n=1 Tax=Esox lucius TaxID=8010 RepID=A0AAY5KNI6_ESOLU|nr:sushi domain-containing protein 3 [Esox lucius]